MISFELPLPPAELSPNARCHWAKKAAIVAAYRYEAQEVARTAMFRWKLLHHREWEQLPEPVHATVTFILKTRRARDFDNLLGSLKSGIDGLRDARLIREDSVWSLQYTLKAVHEPESRRGTAIPQKRQARVRIELEGAP